MVPHNEKAGRGGNPNQPDISSLDTKRIAFNRREINGKQDHASRKLYLLRLHSGIRHNDLGRLVKYRSRNGLDIGSESGWAAVIANLAECSGVTADAYVINEFARRLGLPSIDYDIAAAASRSADQLIMPAYVAGKLLGVTSGERAAAIIRSLEATDEPADERKRRLNRERQRKRRAVTRHRGIKARDTRRRTASPALRALHSSSAVRLPLRQEPQPFPFPLEKKDQGRNTQGMLGLVPSLIPAGNIAGSRPPICEPFDLSQPSNPEPSEDKTSFQGEQNDNFQTAGYPGYRTRMDARGEKDSLRNDQKRQHDCDLRSVFRLGA